MTFAAFSSLWSTFVRFVCVDFQTILILYAMRRHPSSPRDVSEMPGRGTFSFLIIGNVAAWVQRTMQASYLIQYKHIINLSTVGAEMRRCVLGSSRSKLHHV